MVGGEIKDMHKALASDINNVYYTRDISYVGLIFRFTASIFIKNEINFFPLPTDENTSKSKLNH